MKISCIITKNVVHFADIIDDTFQAIVKELNDPKNFYLIQPSFFLTRDRSRVYPRGQDLRPPLLIKPLNFIKSEKKRHMHARECAPFWYIIVTQTPPFLKSRIHFCLPAVYSIVLSAPAVKFVWETIDREYVVSS